MEQVKSALTAVEVVKLFAKQDISVQVVKTGKDGLPQRNADTGTLITEMKPLAAEHIVGSSEKGGGVGITTIDGKKYVAPLK
jgi:ATP:corrinoid adenosyltransferase